MCTQPVHILNPKKRLGVADKLFLDVPCGKCEECRKANKNSWVVRTYFQYLETQNLGGAAFYVTLTYNDEYLPVYNGNPGFSKKHIQDFIMRFRACLRDKGYKNAVVKYLVCSEYGKKGRPHYHAIIFVNYPLTDFQKIGLKYYLRRSWSELIRTGVKKYKGRKIFTYIRKPYGFVNFGKKNSHVKIKGVVESGAAITYVCKYINKDMYYPYDELDEGQKEYHPFHLQSKGFGEYAIQHLGLDKKDTNAMQLLVRNGIFTSNSQQFPFAIPQYITRKVLMNYRYYRCVGKPEYEGRFLLGDEHIKSFYSEDTYNTMYDKMPPVTKVEYFLNDFGKDVRKYRDFMRIEDIQKDFYKVFNNLGSFITNEERLKTLIDSCRFEERFLNWTIDDFIYLCKEKFKTLDDTLPLALYQGIFKDRVYLPIYDTDLFSDIEEDSYTLEKAWSYLNFIYSDDRNYTTAIANKYLNDMIAIDDKFERSYNNMLQLLHQHSFACRFDDTLELFIQIYNVCMYYKGIDEREKMSKDTDLYEEAKLLSNEVI